ncbi:MAG: hypothetical protein LH471_07535, partial [Salinibacterium sp.]|nr:hypothetical protein [Salinibacterium sp.]
ELKVKAVPQDEPVVDQAPGEPTGWAAAAIGASLTESAKAAKTAPRATSPTVPNAPTVPKAPTEPKAKPTAKDTRYGESVVREVLGASFLEEHPIAPRVVPQVKEN